MAKPKIAAKHLAPCEITDCRYAHEGIKDTCICCFGLRHEGCIYYNPDMERRLDIHASVEKALTIGMYEQNIHAGASLVTKRDYVDFPSLDNIIEPVLENIGKITKKVYGFVCDGHEYNYRDNSMDYGSCPHCEMLKGHNHLGYYGSGQSRISCFECIKCFKKFYYHAPEKQS